LTWKRLKWTGTDLEKIEMDLEKIGMDMKKIGMAIMEN
jgi:hypothetical protein